MRIRIQLLKYCGSGSSLSKKIIKKITLKRVFFSYSTYKTIRLFNSNLVRNYGACAIYFQKLNKLAFITNFLAFFLLLNADPDPGGKMNADSCGSGSTALTWTGIGPQHSIKPVFRIRVFLSGFGSDFFPDSGFGSS